MRKISTKKVLLTLSILFFLLGGLFIFAIEIDPGKFNAILRIQEINLYYRLTQEDGDLQKNDIVKAGLKNEGKTNGVLYIRPVDSSGDFYDDANNVSYQPEKSSIIGGFENVNRGDETTMIIGGEKNIVDGEGIVLLGGQENTAMVDNAVILGSANSIVGASNGVIIAGKGSKNYGLNSSIMGEKGFIATGAYNSFVIRGGNVNHQGVFSYGSVTSTKPNIVQLYERSNGGGLIVKGLRENGEKDIQLVVHGAIAVGYGKCSNEMIGSVYYVPGKSSDDLPAYCLCACVKSGADSAASIALSNQPYCNDLCESDGEKPLGKAQCGTRGFEDPAVFVYEHGETKWRTASNFCADNRLPIAYEIYNPGEYGKQGNDRKICNHDQFDESCEPSFMGPGKMLEWVCPGVGVNDSVKCQAYRRAEPPEPAACGRNARRYLVTEKNYLGSGASDFCKWGTPVGGERNPSIDGTVVGWKKVSAQMLSAGNLGTYNMGAIDGSEMATHFPEAGGRAYWICETENASVEGVVDSEKNQVECYADRLTCNHCANAGFPYCFDVDFSEDCSEGIGECMPGSDNYGEDHALYASWNSDGRSDTMYAEESTVTHTQDNWITVNFVNENGYYYANYSLKKNETSSVRTGVVKYTTTDSAYCPNWDVYIVQCPKGQVLDSTKHACISNVGVIVYDCNGGDGDMDNQEIEVGQKGNLNDNQCSREGFDFLGWAESSSATSEKYKNKAEFTFSEAKTITLHAVWKQKEIQKYTVTFDPNGGGGTTMSAQQFTAGESKKLSKNTFTREGYTFDGWNTKSDGKGNTYIDEQTITISADLPLYAVWKENEVQKHTVTFDANGGLLLTDEFVPVSHNTVLDLSNYKGSKSKSDFVGWNTYSTATTAMSNPTITSDITLYAVYTEKDTCKYTEGVTYGSDYSIIVSSCNDRIVVDDRNVGASTRSTTSYGSRYSWADEPNWYYGPQGWTFNPSTVQEPGSNIMNLCRDGYHVPSDDEWNELVSIWDSISPEIKASYPGATREEKFLNKLYLPSTGTTWYEVGGGYEHANWATRQYRYLPDEPGGYYWTSRANGDGNDYMYDGVFMFRAKDLITYDNTDYRNEFYVRCFKNASSSNGGSDASCPAGCSSKDGYCIKSCFTAGTKVTMADGTQKNIEDVKIGEKLLSPSGVNKVLGYDRPKLGNRHLWSINGGKYFVSDEHPFMTTKGWKSFNPEMTKMEVNLDVKQLNVGDILVKANGYEKIETIDYISSGYDTQLYNFVLDGDHTFYADDYLVHNKLNGYEYTNGSAPGEGDVCQGNKSLAVAGNKLCCPNTNSYYGDGSSCLLMCTNYSRD